MPSTTESPPSAGSGASGLRPSSGCSAAAEGCIPIQALREKLSCGLELVANKAEAKEPSAHCVFGVLVLLGLGACGSDCLCHLAECKAQLNVTLELSGVESVLLAVCWSIELEEPELDRSLGEGGVEVQHMVAAVVVVLASAVVGVLAAVPNISQGCHGGGFSVVQPFQESGGNRAAVAADAASVEVQCACQEVFVACHDVGEVSERLGRVPLGADVDVNTAASGGIAFRSGFAEAANQLLQGFHVSAGEDRRDHLAFFAVRARDADVLLEFPLASALIPSRPSAVAVAASGVLVPPGTKEGGCQPCGLLSGDAVHFDLDPDGLLLHFGYLVFCSLAHVCDLRFGLFSLSVVTYYL